MQFEKYLRSPIPRFRDVRKEQIIHDAGQRQRRGADLWRDWQWEEHADQLSALWAVGFARKIAVGRD